MSAECLCNELLLYDMSNEQHCCLMNLMCVQNYDIKTESRMVFALTLCDNNNLGTDLEYVLFDRGVTGLSDPEYFCLKSVAYQFVLRII